MDPIRTPHEDRSASANMPNPGVVPEKLISDVLLYWPGDEAAMRELRRRVYVKPYYIPGSVTCGQNQNPVLVDEARAAEEPVVLSVALRREERAVPKCRSLPVDDARGCGGGEERRIIGRANARARERTGETPGHERGTRQKAGLAVNRERFCTAPKLRGPS